MGEEGQEAMGGDGKETKTLLTVSINSVNLPIILNKEATMSPTEEKGMKEKILDVAVSVIDESGGGLGVNLREVARRAGCSAQNVYNYFTGLDGLLNAAMTRIVEHFHNAMTHGNPESPEEYVRRFVEYALDYPGRFNFYYFERLAFVPSAETLSFANRTGQDIHSRTAAGENRGDIAAEYAGTYALGALVPWVTERKKPTDRAETAGMIVRDTMALIKAVTAGLAGAPGEDR